MSVLMRSAIAAKVAQRLKSDSEMSGCVFLDGASGLATAVASEDTLFFSAPPALVVTTSSSG